MKPTIRCGDSVFHRPSRETWLVAWCDGEWLQWCGWPPGLAPEAECLVVKKATETEHRKLVAEILGRPRNDMRTTMVRRLYGGEVHACT